MPEAASTPAPVLSNLPPTSGAQQTGASVESGVGGLVVSFSAMGPGDPKSPLFAISSSLGQVSASLNFNPEPLKKLYPDALTVMRNALPADSLEYVRSIEQAYREAQGFLRDSALVRAVKPGSTLQEVALAAVEDALRLFDERQLSLHENLIDPELLEEIRDALTAFEQFRTDFAARSADFLPFLSKHLFGLDPDLLKNPLAHLEAALKVLGPLDAAAAEAALKAAQQAVAQAFRDLSDEILSFDPADATAYVRIQAGLDALEAATRALHAALAPLYAQLRGLFDSHAWDDIFPGLARLLKAVTFDAPPTVDDAIHAVRLIIEGIQGRLQTILLPEDIVKRAEELSRELYELFSSSAVGQVRRVLREFLEQIRKAIESVPAEGVQQAVEDMLGRVKQEIDELGIEDLAQPIERGFRQAETFITENINDALKNDVEQAVKGLLDNLNNLPVEMLFSNIEAGINRVQGLLNELDAALTAGMGEVKGVMARLEQLSFKPVGDPIVAEIDELKKRIQAMNPNALSDPEKLAIKTALAFLEGFDIENIIVEKARSGFDTAKDSVKPLLDDLGALLESLRERLEAYRPDRFVAALTGLLEQAQGLADRLDAKALLKPLYEQVDGLERRLESVSPGSLLDPLQKPYATVVSAVNQLSPERLIAPLNALYAEIDELISRVDVTPLFDELDRRRKDLFKQARDRLLSALDGLGLPPPLKEFLAAVRPVVQAMTDALFLDPEKEFAGMGRDISTRFDITGVFKPLDKFFDELMRTVRDVPAGDLIAAFETLRKTVGVGLGALDPANITGALRGGQRLLEELSPHLLFSLPLGLPSLKVAFAARVAVAPASRKADAKALLLRFDAVVGLTSPAGADSLVAGLAEEHRKLTNALRGRVNSLDASEAAEAYAGLREQLTRVLPDFLRRTAALTHSEVLAGLESLRPSRKAGELQEVFDRFRQQLEPMREALEEAGQKFFRAIRDTLDLLNPLSLKDAVAEIYKTIREKVRVLDPERLAAALREGIFEPVTEALKALDPATLKARLDAAYRKVLNAVADKFRPLLEQIKRTLDTQLQEIREKVKEILDKVKGTVGRALAIFNGMVKQVEELVFVEILERLRKVLDNLGVSFDKELDRIRNAFDQMLAALPLDIAPRKVEVTASVSV